MVIISRARTGASLRHSLCFEIEDRHPLSPEKLWFYCGLYDTLDFCGHNLRLFVFDRYGHNKRELDLCVLYLDGVIEMATGPP